MSKIVFFSGAARISAVISMPGEVNGKVPCAILCHGYTSYRDEFGAFIKMSDELCRNGIGVLRFDFRGCGESVGSFRKGRMLCSTEWVEDVYNAFQFILTQEWADPDNIAAIGMSMGGAALLSALKHLNGMKKAIAISPVNNGYEWLKGLWTNRSGEIGWNNFLRDVHIQIRQRLTTGVDELIGADKILAFTPEDYKVFTASTKQFPLSTEYATWLSAEEIVYRLNTSRELMSSTNDIPVLFIHGTGDTLVPWKGTEEMYKSYPFKKELMLLDGKPHGLLLDDDIGTLLEAIVRWIKD